MLPLWKTGSYQKKLSFSYKFSSSRTNIQDAGKRPMGLTPGPTKSGAKYTDNNPPKPSPRKLISLKELIHSTSGSAGLDILCPEDITIYPGACPYMLETGILGPPPPDTMGLILGRSSLNIKGISVTTGVIDSDSMGEIIVVITVPVTWTFKKGEAIAQIVIVPYVKFGTSDKTRIGGFGSTDPGAAQNPIVALVTKVKDEHPMIKLHLEGQPFNGMIDTGAQITVISDKEWPKNWPLQEIPYSLEGIGGLSSCLLSTRTMTVYGPENQKAIIRPHVGPFSPSLWGRDLHKQWKAEFHIPLASEEPKPSFDLKTQNF